MAILKNNNKYIPLIIISKHFTLVLQRCQAPYINKPICLYLLDIICTVLSKQLSLVHSTLFSCSRFPLKLPSNALHNYSPQYHGWCDCRKFTHFYMLGVFGCKIACGSKEMRKYNCSLLYLSKHRKRKIRKPLFSFLFSLLHNHFLISRVLQLILWSCKSHLW